MRLSALAALQLAAQAAEVAQPLAVSGRYQTAGETGEALVMTAGWLDELCGPPPVLPADLPPQNPPTPQEEIASSQRHACHPAMREEARVFVRALRLSDDGKRADVKLTLTLASPPAGRNKHAVLASRVSALLVIGRLPAAG